MNWTSPDNMEQHVQKHAPDFGGREAYLEEAARGPDQDAVPVKQRCRRTPDGGMDCTTGWYSPSRTLLHVLRNRDRRLVSMYRFKA